MPQADAIAVHSPCGRFILRLEAVADEADPVPCAATLYAEVKQPAEAATERALYAVQLDDRVCTEATVNSGSGVKRPDELADMIHAALVGRSSAVEYALLTAAEALGDAQLDDGSADALVLRLTYRAEFTNAVIVLTLCPSSPRAAGLRSSLPLTAGEYTTRIAELEAMVAERDATIRRLEEDKAKITHYTKTTLQVLRAETDGLKAQLARSGDSRAVQAMHEAVARARRDAENARAEVARCHREVEQLKAELRRQGSAPRRGRSTTPPPFGRGSSRDHTPTRGGPTTGRYNTRGSRLSDASSVDSRRSAHSYGGASPSSVYGRPGRPADTHPRRSHQQQQQQQQQPLQRGGTAASRSTSRPRNATPPRNDQYLPTRGASLGPRTSPRAAAPPRPNDSRSSRGSMGGKSPSAVWPGGQATKSSSGNRFDDYHVAGRRPSADAHHRDARRNRFDSPRAW